MNYYKIYTIINNKFIILINKNASKYLSILNIVNYAVAGIFKSFENFFTFFAYSANTNAY